MCRTAVIVRRSLLRAAAVWQRWKPKDFWRTKDADVDARSRHRTHRYLFLEPALLRLLIEAQALEHRRTHFRPTDRTPRAGFCLMGPFGEPDLGHQLRTKVVHAP